MNLRGIKKDIEYVLSAFIEDCSIFAAVNSNSDDKLAALVEEGVDLYNELKDKVNGKVEGSKKTYFNNLRKETLEKTDALYEKLSALVKEAAAAPEKKEAKPAVAKPAVKKAPAAEKKPAAAKKPAAEKKPATEKKAAAAKKPAAEKKPAAAKKPAAKKAAAKAE